MSASENSNAGKEIETYIQSLNETIADSQLFMRLIRDYLESENDQAKKVLLAEMLMSKERAHGGTTNSLVNGRSENSPTDY